MKTIFILVLGLVAAQAYADGGQGNGQGGNGPCKTYREACSGQGLTPGKGLFKCMAQQAKAANDQTCLAAMKARRAKRAGGDGGAAN